MSIHDRKRKSRLGGTFFAALACCLLIGMTVAGCGGAGQSDAASDAASSAVSAEASSQETDIQEEPPAEIRTESDAPAAESEASSDEPEEADVQKEEVADPTGQSGGGTSFSPEDIPAFDGAYSVSINGGVPFFTDADLAFDGEAYSALDAFGRCGPCMALVGPETLPTEPRGQIGEVHPSGWQIAKYAGIEGNYLYNRSHLIGFQLTGENANPENLITGTRYMNAQVMEPIESMVGSYVRNTGHHVLYRATPVFEGEDLVARGVLLEAQSIEDDQIRLNTFCYNAQPGITIDYATGDSTGPAYEGDSAGAQSADAQDAKQTGGQEPDAAAQSSAQIYGGQAGAGEGQTREIPGVGREKEIDADVTYVGNANSMKFHRKDCSSVQDMADHNMVPFHIERQEIIDAGYEPCGRCHP